MGIKACKLECGRLEPPSVSQSSTSMDDPSAWGKTQSEVRQKDIQKRTGEGYGVGTLYWGQVGTNDHSWIGANEYEDILCDGLFSLVEDVLAIPEDIEEVLTKIFMQDDVRCHKAHDVPSKKIMVRHGVARPVTTHSKTSSQTSTHASTNDLPRCSSIYRRAWRHDIDIERLGSSTARTAPSRSTQFAEHETSITRPGIEAVSRHAGCKVAR